MIELDDFVSGKPLPERKTSRKTKFDIEKKWGHAATEMLLELWNKDYTAGHIATMMTAMTGIDYNRNEVGGKIFRMRRSGRHVKQRASPIIRRFFKLTDFAECIVTVIDERQLAYFPKTSPKTTDQ